MHENQLHICAILESHIDISQLVSVCKKICKSWDWTSNGGLCSKGTRIILGWNSDIVDVMVLSQTDQVMHAQVIYKIDKKAMFCSFVYADNYYKNRRELWQNLSRHKVLVGNRPWVILGDFNSSLNLEDSFSGSSSISIGMREFKECVEMIEMFDINSMGLHYTWNQKPKKGVGILKKIDRIMGNIFFTDLFPTSCAIFQPYRVSDHSPCVLKLPSVSRPWAKPFKFANFLVNKDEYNDIVEKAWKESECLKQFNEAVLDEESFLKQKSKVEWLAVGDSNTSYFHNSLKCRNHRSRIDVVKDVHGVLHEGGNVQVAFVQHYQQFLGCEGLFDLLPSHELFSTTIEDQAALNMIRKVTDDEIKATMFSIGECKAPGPDGFTSAFFKKSWSIVGKDVLLAVHDFFNKGKLLKELNHTIIALVPSSITDYRPISCCNVLYKCISKILADRIKYGLKTVVSINQ
uniref:uncharacterized protein LOC122610317 n=1 Tax=Erigeron canadensis TaxID=72917 RepID=UPI001CB94EA5|nr:uncharacterized protein LOC122610317 [Erigeron canadensis]